MPSVAIRELASTQDGPPGFCKCGCGTRTEIAKRNRPERGWVLGQPRPYFGNHGHLPLPPKAELARIFDKCEPVGMGYATPCLIWRGPVNANGYVHGRYRDAAGKRHSRPLHRRVYSLIHPTEDLVGKHVHHRCEQERCLNPEHLELLDVAVHHHHHKARLSDAQVLAFRQRHAAGERVVDLARDAGYSHTGSFCNMLSGRTYKHVPMAVRDAGLLDGES